jgi:hypothetical protein
MTPSYFLEIALAPALRILPVAMDTKAARAMCLTIALQESRIEHRRQINGPARGYFQFEQGGGVHGVLVHPQSAVHIRRVLDALDYDPDMQENACWTAIEHNDILAAAFGRLLLWTLPDKLPTRDDPETAWKQYKAAWRPGRARSETWAAFYAQAWEVVLPTKGVLK